jgi:DNA-binding NarL/FixJ family response regulator
MSKLLIISKDTLARSAYGHAFDSHTCIFSEENPEKARQLTSAHRPDCIILCDPNVTKALEIIKNLRGVLPETPIIVTGLRPDPEGTTQTQLEAAGASKIFTAVTDMEDIIPIVTQLLSAGAGQGRG